MPICTFPGSSKVLIQTATLKDFRHNVSNPCGLPQLCTRWERERERFWSKNLCGADHTFQPQGLTFPLNYGHLTAAPNTVHGEVDDQMQPKTQLFTWTSIQVVHWTLGALLYRTRFFPLRWDAFKTDCAWRSLYVLHPKHLKPTCVLQGAAMQCSIMCSSTL